MSLPSACTYLPPRKKTCTHPCKIVTRKNRPQCRTKYFRKGKGKQKKGMRTKTKKRTRTQTQTQTQTKVVHEEEKKEEEEEKEASTTDKAETNSTDPLKSMVNLFSKRVSFLQQKPV